MYKRQQYDTSTPLMLVDNQSAINMAESYENSKRTRHIDIKFHYIKDIVAKGLIKLKYISTSENIADILTKSLCNVKFQYFCEKLKIM